MREDSDIYKTLTNKRILVTGGAGFIGSHLVEALLKYGAELTVIDNLRTGKLENIKSMEQRITYINGDIRNMDTLLGLGEFDIIFNEAADQLLQSFDDVFSDLQINTGGLINILELARKYDAKVIHASTGSVYGNLIKVPVDESHPISPISPYGASKYSAELYCKLFFELYGIDVTCLRYFNVYGPRQLISEESGVIPIFISRIVSGKPINIFGDGSQTRDFLHVNDCVRANLLAACSPAAKGLALNIGGKGIEVKIIDLAYLLMRIIGKSSPIVFKEPKLGDIRRLVADSSFANKIIGYNPTVDLERGLKDLYNYYSKELIPKLPLSQSISIPKARIKLQKPATTRDNINLEKEVQEKTP